MQINGNVKIKFISEFVHSSGRSLSIDTRQSLSGIGFELYQNLIQDSVWVVNQVKSSYEIKLEKRFEKLNDMEGSVELILEKYKLEKKLEKEIEKRKLKPLKRKEINDKMESVGLILESRILRGEITNAASRDIINVQKSVIEIGIRIDWQNPVIL